ncbi:hypothetical protein N7510_011145 [Penicillium lagena]|uniref:uncharacterized protein n=1 Tax=Penicillium lagena TaxID=94218 RepID=UPI0025400182|nr:uncharacterized protein N7510_011145 [Penicillium lagena]KAJ5601611.1 hypothetical protein N7510_011145 [Penicillium lagena]
MGKIQSVLGSYRGIGMVMANPVVKEEEAGGVAIRMIAITVSCDYGQYAFIRLVDGVGEGIWSWFLRSSRLSSVADTCHGP